MVSPLLILLAVSIVGGGVLVTQPQLFSSITNAVNGGIPLPINTTDPNSIPHQGNLLVKDMANTIMNKVNVPSNNQLNITPNQTNDIKNASKTLLFSSLDFLGAVKHLASTLLTILAPTIFGVNVPAWLIPLVSLLMVVLLAGAIIKHAGKIVFIVLLIGLVIVALLAFTGLGK